jgi:hypothetical protein
LATPCRSSHAWQRNTSRRSGSFARADSGHVDAYPAWRK